MTIINFKFKNSKEILKTDKIYNIIINEKEEQYPTLKATLPISLFSEIQNATTCQMLLDNQIVFCGNITSISNNDNHTIIIIESRPLIKNTANPTPSPNFLNLFSDETKMFFSNLTIKQTTKIGELHDVSMIYQQNKLLQLDDYIIDKSIKIEKSSNQTVSSVNLTVSASWLCNITDDEEIYIKNSTNLIANYIQTFTPNKLIASWPKRLQKIAKTKYTIASSQLKQILSSSSDALQIEKNCQIKLQKATFDHSLAISWDFEQLINETFSAKIVNNLCPNGTERIIYLNLQNIQEYLEQPDAKTFFTHQAGKDILSYIYQMLGNYILMSMRDIIISFTMIFDSTAEMFNSLTLNKWLKINNYIVKISEIEYNLSNKQKIINIKACGFSTCWQQKPTISIQNLPCTPSEQQLFCAIKNISIENEADEQFEKLSEYLEQLKESNNINKDNCKEVISNFLNQNPTKIFITLNPLLQQHIEKHLVTIEQPQYFS